MLFNIAQCDRPILRQNEMKGVQSSEWDADHDDGKGYCVWCEKRKRFLTVGLQFYDSQWRYLIPKRDGLLID